MPASLSPAWLLNDFIALCKAAVGLLVKLVMRI